MAEKKKKIPTQLDIARAEAKRPKDLHDRGIGALGPGQNPNVAFRAGSSPQRSLTPEEAGILMGKGGVLTQNVMQAAQDLANLMRAKEGLGIKDRNITALEAADFFNRETQNQEIAKLAIEQLSRPNVMSDAEVTSRLTAEDQQGIFAGTPLAVSTGGQGTDVGQAASNALTNTAIGAGTGVAAGAVLGGIGAIPGAIIGTATGAITGFKSGLKSQVEENIASKGTELAGSTAILNDVIAGVNLGTYENIDEAYQDFALNLARIDKAHSELKLATQSDLNKFVSADGKKRLEQFETFNTFGGRADLIRRFNEAVLTPDANKGLAKLSRPSAAEI